MKKIGIFLNGEVVLEYPYVPELYLKAANKCKAKIKETGHFHELKLFEENENIETAEMEEDLSKLADMLIKKGTKMPYEKAWEKIQSKGNVTFEAVLEYIKLKNK